MIITDHDIYLLKLVDKFKVISLTQLALALKRKKSNVSNRITFLESEKLIRKHKWINNITILTISSKGANFINSEYRHFKFNPIASLITSHELKVFEIATHLSNLYNVDLLTFDVHSDLSTFNNRFGVADLSFYSDETKIVVEIERTAKSVKRITDKLINNLTKDSSKIFYFIEKKHKKIIKEITRFADIYSISIFDYNSLECIHESQVEQMTILNGEFI